MLRAVLEHASDGVFIVEVLPTEADGNQGIDFRAIALNPALARKVSLSTSNITEFSLEECLPPALAQTTRLSLRCCLEQGHSISYEASFKLEDRSCTLLTTLSPVWSSNGRISKIVGICQDVTERRRVLEEGRLLQSITLAIAESQNFHAALSVAVRKICEFTHWDYGEAWIVSPDGATLERSPAWYGSGDRAKQFRRSSQGLSFSPDSGFYGQVWSLEHSDVAPDISQAPESSLLRGQQAILTGFKAGLAVPILASGEVLAVLVFFMSQPRSADKRLIELVSTIAVQLGVVLHHKKYRNIFENAVAGMFQTTVEGRFLTANPMLARMCGYDSAEELISSITDIQEQLYVNPSRREEFRRLIEQQDAVWGFEAEVYRKDGSTIWIAKTARAMRDSNNRIVGYEGTIEDITQRKQAAIELHKRDSLLQGIADAMQSLIAQSNYRTAIHSALEILGKATEVDRICVYEHYLPPTQDKPALSLRFEWSQDSAAAKTQKPEWQNFTDKAAVNRWTRALSAGHLMCGVTRECPEAERKLLEAEGIVSFLIVPIVVHDRFWGCISFEDCHSEERWSNSEVSILSAIAASIGGVLQRHESEEIIRHRAFHDILTGLPNRLLFDEQLEIALSKAHQSVETLAVMFLDLDRFKIINDTLGHTVGDQLLRQATERLKGCLRDGDLVARWGGDEFILMLPHIRSSEDAAKVAQRIIEALQPPFELEGNKLFITSSIGIALYPKDGENGETLIANADAALYRAKELGRNHYQIYAAGMKSQNLPSLPIETP